MMPYKIKLYLGSFSRSTDAAFFSQWQKNIEFAVWLMGRCGMIGLFTVAYQNATLFKTKRKKRDRQSPAIDSMVLPLGRLVTGCLISFTEIFLIVVAYQQQRDGQIAWTGSVQGHSR